MSVESSSSATVYARGKSGPGTFRRGVHPAGSKSLSADSAVEVLPSPGKLLLALLQHTGRAAELVVKPRDIVEADLQA